METVFLVAVALLAGVPLLTLLHELGHAVVAAVAVGGRVTVLQGPEPRPFELPLWRIDLRLHGPVAPHQAWIGWARWSPASSPPRHALALAGGPAVSALASGLCLFGAGRVDGAARWILLALALDASAQFLSSSLPVRYPAFAGAYAAHASDGLMIRRLLSTEAPRRDLAPPAPTLRDHAEGHAPEAPAEGRGSAVARS